MSSSSPSPRSSPTHFSEVTTEQEPASTAPSTPHEISKEIDTIEDSDAHYGQLSRLLERSSLFSNFLKERMEELRAQQRAEYERLKAERATRQPSANKGAGKKRTRTADRSFRMKKRKGESGLAIASSGSDDEIEQPPIFPQPTSITGAKMKNYQLEGLQWLASLHRNGMSGILADEMGLGKTLQTISFSAYLREERFSKPFMIVCPLSVLHNWMSEYQKFAPSIPVCMYYGTPEERAQLRKTVMALPAGAKPLAPGKPQPKRRPQNRSVRRRRKRGSLPSTVLDDETLDDLPQAANGDRDAEEIDIEDALAFPVVITTYEMIIKDRNHLARYDWGYIVVDEGHRLKNLDCKLMREIKTYRSAGRMILTGTPLQNNLSELWALMSFVLPDIFDDVELLEEWFNLPNIQQSLGSDRSSTVVDALHGILKPFLLRRLKADVEMHLPPKKEYVLYAPLSEMQREMYPHVLKGTLRSYLIKAAATADPLSKESHDSRKPCNGDSRRRRKSYLVDGDDDEYFDMLARGEVDERGVKKDEGDANLEQMNAEYRMKSIVRRINALKLQSPVMQARKTCSHPFLFDWPLDPRSSRPILDERIVNASGKMMVLDRLLPELFKRKHKVLLFSQFKTSLDIIEDWAREMKGWGVCRIDGQTSADERRAETDRFQSGGDTPDAPILFLLSTRAGGLGLNLVAADTVIFYDQDWNPQVDAQAQDRAHRIGQTKPVLVFRLTTRNTIETKIMERAAEKRKLEAVVIAKGKFKAPAAIHEGYDQVTASLLEMEAEQVDMVTTEDKADVLSDQDLEMLLDRRPEVFVDRGTGWTSVGDGHAGATRQKPTFAVYEAPRNAGNDILGNILEEEDD